MERLIIPKKDYESIIKYCENQLPREACGLMAGYWDAQVGVVTKVFLLTNIKNSTEEYQVDPGEQVEVFNQLETQNLELVSIFHSHPHNPPYPSKTDLERAYYPESVYTIISFMSGESEVRAFRITGNAYYEIQLKVN